MLGSGSRGNSTLVATERTRLLIDTGFSKRETLARLAAIGERADAFDAAVISHEHSDHVNGLRGLSNHLRIPVFLSAATKAAISWAAELKQVDIFTPGRKFCVGDIEITPFSIPHDAQDPVAFTLETQGLKIGIVTDLGYVPEIVRQHVRGCHFLVFESNHDLEMLRVGPYPWHIKQRVMGRQGHLSNNATGEFLTSDYDGSAAVLVLAHLSEQNNHPEIARLSAVEALERRPNGRPELHLASQSTPTKVFQF